MIRERTVSERYAGLFQRRDLAALYGVSQESIRVWERRGTLPKPVQKIGRTPYWRRDQFQDLLVSA